MELNDASLAQLFTEARTHNQWQPREVPDELLQRLYDLLKWGPTAANTTPARFVFVKSAEAKEKLKPALDAGNVAKTMAAPVTVIVGIDTEFYEKMGFLFPHAPGAREWYAGKPEVIAANGLRNGSLQGAYLIIAARALGLDCGPMGGFNAAKVDEAFFAGTSIKSNFLVNLGYGDPAGLRPRGPRFAFDEVCRVV